MTPLRSLGDYIIHDYQSFIISIMGHSDDDIQAPLPDIKKEIK